MSGNMQYEVAFCVVLGHINVWCVGSYALLRKVRACFSTKSDEILELPIALGKDSTEPCAERLAVRGCDILGIIYSKTSSDVTQSV